jgi:hypothetical protein
MLNDVRVEHGEDGEAHCQPTALGEGVLPRDAVLRLLEMHVPAQTTVVIGGRSIDDQLAWLGCRGGHERVSSPAS